MRLCIRQNVVLAKPGIDVVIRVSTKFSEQADEEFVR